MIACFDVDYREKEAQAACVIIDEWEAAQVAASYTQNIQSIEDYISGQFYRRELPCILDVYQLIQEPVDYIVLDSYVYLNSKGKPGLGAYLYEKLNQQIPVIGVAKNTFKEENVLAVPIIRGNSQKPLYVSSAGVDTQRAAQWISKMHGAHRFPTMLKKVDHLARSW